MENDEIEGELSPQRRAIAMGAVRVRDQIGPWVVEYRWPKDVDQGGPWSVTITPSPDAKEEDVAGGIASTLVRQLDFQAASNKWRVTRKHMIPEDDRVDHINSARLKRLLEDGVSDPYLAALAFVYVRLVMEGERSVIAKLSELVGRKPETIKLHLKQARSRELLTTVKGRAGGHLTPKAREILRRPK